MSEDWIAVCALEDVPVLGARVIRRLGAGDIAVFRNTVSDIASTASGDLLRLQRAQRCGGRNCGEHDAAHGVELTRRRHAKQPRRYRVPVNEASFYG